MNVIILTEGGKDYGFGHVARCSSIYQAFRKFCITPQFIVNGDKSIDAICKILIILFMTGRIWNLLMMILLL